jgi:MYXO-CTERM domain-containing protein
VIWASDAQSCATAVSGAVSGLSVEVRLMLLGLVVVFLLATRRRK